MPKPPTIPTLDWQAIFEAGLPYAAWIETGEAPENRQKMETLRQEQVLDPKVIAYLPRMPKRVYVIAIAEDWCGDVVRHVPVLQKIAEATPNLAVRFITREQRPDVFVRFLTNGGEAIPKFIFLSDNWVEVGSWGPMPSACRELIAKGKACADVASARKKVSAAYAADAERRVVVKELVEMLELAATTAV